MFKLVLEKAKEPESKWPASIVSSKKQESSRKTFTSALLTMPKPLTVSVQFNHSVVSHSLCPHGPQYARPPCPSQTPRVYSSSPPLSRCCHPTISSSVIPFSSCLQSSPSSGSFQMSQLFTLGPHKSQQTEKFFKRLEYQSTLPVSCEICMQVKKQ